MIGTTVLTTTLGYDPDGNTLAQTVQTRDPSGNVQTFTDNATFNAADWQTSATDNGLTTQYGYDAAGQQRTETIGNGAATVTRTLDPNGRETALAEGGYTSTFGYNPNDQTTAITLPGGVSESAQYDQNNRLTVWHDPGPGQNVTYGYGYDAARRVTSFTAVSGTDTLGYDPQNRLTSDCGPQVEAHSPDACYRWTYDGGDNIHTATTDVGTPVTYTYNAQNELMQLHAPAYANVDTYYAYDQKRPFLSDKRLGERIGEHVGDRIGEARNDILAVERIPRVERCRGAIQRRGAPYVGVLRLRPQYPHQACPATEVGAGFGRHIVGAL